MKKFIFIFLFLNPSFLFSQYYYGEEVLQRSFEQVDFFFVPNRLNPYAYEGFSKAILGIIDDPILNLNLNPASFKSDTSGRNYFYLDFRSLRELSSENNDVYPITAYASESSRFAPSPYPNYFTSKREIPEPIFSLALFSNKIFDSQDLFFGITYQLIYQNEKYYAVPYDIYRSELGYDYSGKSLAEINNFPVIDKYSGSDNMHVNSHKSTFYFGYKLSDNLQIGTSVSRTTLKRNGTYGSKNVWEYSNTSNSYWYNMETRKQNYNHLDYSFGIENDFDEKNKFGLSFGLLNGKADQFYNDFDTTSYLYGTKNSSNYGENFHKNSKVQNWEQNGKTNYATFFWKNELTPSQKIRFNYFWSKENTDLTLNSEIDDTSKYYYNYAYTNNSNESNSFYHLKDSRTGSGIRNVNYVRIGGVYDWKVNDVTRIEIGMNYEETNSTTSTTEPVSALRNSYSSSTYNNSTTTSRQNISESKILNWDFKYDRTNIHIPIIFHFNEGEKYSYLFGFNRQLSAWVINDNVLANFNYKDETLNGKNTKKENYGERYTTPEENISTVTTSILIGGEFSSQESFTLRLLFSPTISRDNYYGNMNGIQFNWWLGLILRP